MYIEKVKLKNIRGFADLELDLRQGREELAGWTVLAGCNGTGKTTLLQAMAAALLGPMGAAWLVPDPKDWIRRDEDEGRIDLWLQGRDGEDLRDLRDTSGAFRMGVSWSRSGGVRTHPPADDHGFIISQFWDAATLGARPQGWFFAGYGDQRTARPSASLDAERLMKSVPRRAGVVTLFRSDASLEPALEWLSRDLLSEVFAGDRRAAQMKGSLGRLLGDGLLSEDGETETPVTIDPQGVSVRRPEGWVRLQELGQGFHALGALIIDIVRQMIGFFGEDFSFSLRPGEKHRPSIEHSGVVVIDEAENHLHPRLQQRLGFWFKEHFPNVQFIVTTHSPFVCQAADRGGLLRLPGRGKVEPVSEDTYAAVVNGTADDAVLSELFGMERAHSERAEEKRQRLADIEARILRGEATEADLVERRAIMREVPLDPKTSLDDVLEALRDSA